MIWPYGEPVTLLRTELDGIDDYGNDVLIEVEQIVQGCAIWPSDTSGSNENAQAGDLIVTGYTVLVPPDVEVLATDRMRLADGQTYEIVGTPGVWRSVLTNLRPGSQVALQLVTG